MQYKLWGSEVVLQPACDRSQRSEKAKREVDPWRFQLKRKQNLKQSYVKQENAVEGKDLEAALYLSWIDASAVLKCGVRGNGAKEAESCWGNGISCSQGNRARARPAALSTARGERHSDTHRLPRGAGGTRAQVNNPADSSSFTLNVTISLL